MKLKETSLFQNFNHKKKLKIKVQEDVENKILHGISLEYDSIINDLDLKYKILLLKPIFSLRNLKTRLAYYSLNRNEINFSLNFVLNYPWDSIKNVLLHEIAHLFAYRIFKNNGESPHGDKFKEACQILRADPKASGEYKPLYDKIFKNDLNYRDKILIKVKKLMALAESNNRFEAEIAMVKAHHLIKKYNINILKNEKNRNFFSIYVGKPKLLHFREEYHLSSILTEFYFVEGTWVSAYVLEKEKMGRVLEISGTIQNINIAYYVYDFIKNFINIQWKQYTKYKKLNRYRKTDFAIGIIEGFRSKFKKQNNKKQDKISHSLIKIDDPLLKKYLKYRYPYVRNINKKKSMYDPDILDDGINIGKKMIISQGIEETSKNKNIFIDFNK